MYTRRGNSAKSESLKELLKVAGYVISLNKAFFKAKDLTNLLGIKPKGRHKLSWDLNALLSRGLIEIYHKNSRNLYHIQYPKKLIDTYHEALWTCVLEHTHVNAKQSTNLDFV